MKKNKFPPGWNEARVRRVIAHYESQTEAEAVAEDEAAYGRGRTMMEVPRDLVPTVRRLIAERAKRTSRRARGRAAKKAGAAAHAKSTAKRKRYSLAELVRGITKRNRHPAIDFGPAVGRELP